MSILVKHMSVGRQEAFDHFRRGNALNPKFEEHKRTLKQRYEDAKTLAEEINQFRNRISMTRFFFGSRSAPFDVHFVLLKTR